MNKKNLDIVLKVLQKKYPFIIGVEYYHIERFGIVEKTYDYKFKFIVDQDILHSLFPTSTIDYEYLKQENNVIHWVTATFNEYGDNHDLTTYGQNLNSIVSSLLSSIIQFDKSFDYVYKIIKSRWT